MVESFSLYSELYNKANAICGGQIRTADKLRLLGYGIPGVARKSSFLQDFLFDGYRDSFPGVKSP